MRTTFGDYRAKMAQEEKANKLDVKKSKVTHVGTSEKSQFVKKSASSGKEENRNSERSDFKFSFNIDSDNTSI